MKILVGTILFYIIPVACGETLKDPSISVISSHSGHRHFAVGLILANLSVQLGHQSSTNAELIYCAPGSTRFIHIIWWVFVDLTLVVARITVTYPMKHEKSLFSLGLNADVRLYLRILMRDHTTIYLLSTLINLWGVSASIEASEASRGSSLLYEFVVAMVC
jgi:hypothetical protein